MSHKPLVRRFTSKPLGGEPMRSITWSVMLSIFVNLTGANKDFEMEMAKTVRVRLFVNDQPRVQNERI